MGDEFTASMYSWQCTSCATKATLVRVGVTSFGELLAVWWCSKCKCRVMCRTPMEEVIAKVPPPPQKLLEGTKEEFTEKDEAFLRAGHVILPKD